MKSININETTCQICGATTDWDSSFGKINFIVCPKCYNAIRSKYKDALDLIFTIADIRSKNLEKDT